MSDQSRLLFITGASTGLGRALAEVALAAGHRVVGTVRDEDARAAIDALAPRRSFGRILDVTDSDAIEPVIAEIETNIGPIDVLMNNAGYGHEGIIEESPIEEMRRQFEVNVFGAVAVLKAVLPHMRRRRAGHILNVTSIGGLMTFPGVGYYHASKFALEAISETVYQEARSFGVHVTAVEPGAFRTDWAGRSMIRTPRSIPEYDALFNPLREFRRDEESGHQPGDPHAAGRAILRLIASDNPPAYLLLGSDALSLARGHYARRIAEIDGWADVTASTDFAKDTAA